MSGIKIEYNKIKIDFGVGECNTRKSKFLYRMRGVSCEPLAYFRNDECAKWFQRAINFMIEAGNHKD